ncbi:ParB/Srx family N-terminal domain-containing protein [Caballeronia sp. LZ034LL]|uniref:ParB/Srx family N-terminal domain-containing protein n=1 Tax=Caballeronia sp. LZ034LL TaxID=3038567 RepID=UPI0028669B7F|nr:ParB/Srx family N-terminal domain-containing protein [Caballeronia sp. LZ034LL]MDR5835537.1 ParB/Srx family N-terminal domain-containing protein [Caballeronia sp. LZ034LL]
MNTLDIDRLRPTQMTHGERQIRQKAEAYRALHARDLKMAIAEKPIAIVLGPDEVPYVIDHHHVAGALLLIGVTRVPFVLLRDFSSLSSAEFWLTLENRSWTYPYDAARRRVAFEDMPHRLADAQNDEFRSLAAFVRDAGGYDKIDVPLADFRWADFFYARLPCPANDADFDALLQPALALAHSPKAAGLPGFIGDARR